MNRIVLLAGIFAAAALAQTQNITINTTSPLPMGYVGVPYQLTFTATTNPPNQPVTWSISSDNQPPAGLTLASNGNLFGTPSAGTAGQYIFTVSAGFTNVGTANIPGASARFSITIGTPQISVFTPTTLPVGFVGQSYAVTLQATSVPSLGITWSPTIPVQGLGLALSSVGVLAGTPNIGCIACVVPITATITGTNVSVTTNFSITIDQGQVTINTTSLPLAPFGKPYTATLASTPPGATWSVAASTPLPPGLSLSTAGVFSGTPSLVGAYPLTILAAAQGYQSAQVTLTLYVTNGPLAIVQNSLPVAIQNAPYTTTVTGTGGLPPYQWSTVNMLGLTIGATTGIITGTPTVLGPQSVPVTLTDSSGAAVTQAFALFVAGPLSVLTSSLPNGSIGASYSQTLQAGGGQAPYTWTLVSGAGSPPAGLSLSSSGIITGTPTANGVSSFTVQVTDFGQRIATKVLSITIAGPTLTITTSALPNGAIGTAYSQTLAASNGTPPYTWSIASGSLPAGLSLDPKSGTVSGTPSGTPATATFTVQVTDSTVGPAPLAAQKAFTITITAAALNITTSSLPNGSVGVAYSQTLQASGGSSPYTWSASAPLPAGLQLNATTGAITGTPTAAGPFAFVVVVKDSSGQTAQQSLAITVTPGLTITTGNISTTVGAAFSQTVTASGGASPYTFALTSGTLPVGLTFSASNGLISGTPTTAGTSTVTFTVTDANKQTAKATITITVSLPVLPPTTFTVSTGSAQPTVTLCLSAAFPQTVTGTLSLSFQTSSSVAVGTDASVQFASPGQGSTVSFSLPACGQNPPASATVTMGTVAGTITINAKLSANGVDITPSNFTPQTITIAAAPPVIQSVKLTQSGGTLTVTVIGFSSTREVTSGVFTFAPATGSTLSQNAIPVQLGSAFTTWYQNSASNAFGSQFMLTVPFTVSASAADVVAVTVTLTNTKGTSAAATSQ